MKQRITFLIPKSAPLITPESFDYDGTTLKLNNVEAWRQDRWTFSSKEVPEILRETITNLGGLEARWQSKEGGVRINPFGAGSTPGAHLFVTEGEEEWVKLLCISIKMASLKRAECKGLESFVKVPNSDKYHFYTPHSHPEDIAAVAKIMLCKHVDEDSKASCIQQTERLLTADSIELTYDKSTDAIIFSALWTANHHSPSGAWDITIPNPSHRLEIGILDERTAVEPADIALGGVIAVLGETKELTETLFTYPAQHFSHPGYFSAHFTTPTNIHPILNLDIHLPAPPPAKDCTLNAYFTTPNYLFIDKYQLSDPQFLASNNLTTLLGPHGDTDLEAPQWTATAWGSEFVLGLKTDSLVPEDTSEPKPTGNLKVKIPLHTRYLLPVPGPDTSVPNTLPYPTLFYACPAPLSDTASPGLSRNPFRPTLVGPEPFFGRDTTFYHLSAVPAVGTEGQGLEARLDVPTLGLAGEGLVRAGTVLAVGCCLGWLGWRIGRSIWGGGRREGEKKTQ